MLKAARWTVKTIKTLIGIDGKHEVRFEIGTESAIRPYTVDELGIFLARVIKGLGPRTFRKRVRYLVIQSGTQISGLSNKNTFNPEISKAMIGLAHDNKLEAKEHNGDFLSLKDLKTRFSLGLDAINIAPELGILETSAVLGHVGEKCKKRLIEFFVDSMKWDKWLTSDASYLEKALFAGHYNFNDGRFKIIVEDYPDLAKILREQIFTKLTQMYQAIS
jgi:hypothetical protein